MHHLTSKMDAPNALVLQALDAALQIENQGSESEWLLQLCHFIHLNANLFLAKLSWENPRLNAMSIMFNLCKTNTATLQRQYKAQQ